MTIIDEENEKSTREELEEIILSGNVKVEQQKRCIEKLKNIIIDKHGLPQDTIIERKQVQKECSLRAVIWKILLNVGTMSTEKYLSLLVKSRVYEKISIDLGRTLKLLDEDDIFNDKLDFTEQLSRILNAYANEQQDKGTYNYVQGMNWLCGMFCIVMPELDAFYSFSKVAKNCIPTYVNVAISGVNNGCEILSICLEYIDQDLHKIFSGMDKVYLVPQLLALFTVDTATNEVLKIWDFLIAYGFHMDLLILAAILVHNKQLIVEMRQDKLSQFLTNINNIEAKPIISLAISFVKLLPPVLFSAIEKHTHEFVDCMALIRKIKFENSQI